jgi:predicted site-specific integrase-resolvase
MNGTHAKTKKQKEEKFLSISKASAFTGLGPGRLREFYKEGLLKGYTTPGGGRRFCVESLRGFCNIDRKDSGEGEKVNYLYARISSKNQSDDLQRQTKFLQDWSADKGIKYTLIEDIGSGINFKRKGLQTILDRCIQGTIGNVTVAHRDRLSRFAFELIEAIVTKAGGSITVIDDSGNKSSEQELAEDLLSIVHIYSCRQMGKRSYGGRSAGNDQNTRDSIPPDDGTEDKA